MAGYQGYSRNSRLSDVVVRYFKKHGATPTLIVVPSDYGGVTGVEGAAVVRSSIVSAILVTHEATEFDHHAIDGPPRDESQGPMLVETTRTMTLTSGRARIEGRCPHCHNRVTDFNALGWWWGWDHGVTPDYWDSLRSFVFRRDKSRCQRCQQKFGADHLNAHHRVPKEQGGVDSARNLVTLCLECHAYIHDHAEELTEEDKLLIAA